MDSADRSRFLRSVAACQTRRKEVILWLCVSCNSNPLLSTRLWPCLPRFGSVHIAAVGPQAQACEL